MNEETKNTENVQEATSETAITPEEKKGNLKQIAQIIGGILLIIIAIILAFVWRQALLTLILGGIPIILFFAGIIFIMIAKE